MQPVFMPPMRGFEPYPFDQGEAPAVPTPGYPVVLSGMGETAPSEKKPLLPKWAIPAAIGLLALGGLAFWYHMSVVNKLKRQSSDSPEDAEEEVELEDVEAAPKLKRRTAKQNPKKAQAAFAKAEKKAKKATAAWLAPKARKAKKPKAAGSASKQTTNLASTPAPRRRQKAAKALVAAAALPAHDASGDATSSES